MNRKVVVLVVLLLGISALAYAQFGGRRGGGGGAFAGAAGQCLVPGYRGTGEEDLPTPRKIAHSGFVYARVRYHLQPFWRGEVPWHHDYPGRRHDVSDLPGASDHDRHGLRTPFSSSTSTAKNFLIIRSSICPNPDIWIFFPRT